MRLCLTCRKLSGSGTLFCSHCGRTFGGRRCPKDHLSPAWSRFCPTCGATALTDPTPYMPFGWATRLLAIAALIVGVRLLFGWCRDILDLGLVGAFGAAGLLTGVPGQFLMVRTLEWVYIVVLLYIVSHFLPAPTGANIRQGLYIGLKWLWRGAQMAWAAARRLLQ